MLAMPTHSERRCEDPARWVLYLSHSQPVRLVVFVHGFRGRAVDTWQCFPEGGQTRSWWRESDLLFVGYRSDIDDITAAAGRLIDNIPRFFPDLPPALLEVGDARVRDVPSMGYQQLVLVGHSLGGLVIRVAVSEVADDWVQRGMPTPKPALLDAGVRLFSPAIAGFRPAGFLGLMRASPAWGALRMYLHRSSAYTDLQDGSSILRDTRARTEELARQHPQLGALSARIVWANPDRVVRSEKYRTDPLAKAIEEQSHSSVCKPNAAYTVPWSFVEQG